MFDKNYEDGCMQDFHKLYLGYWPQTLTSNLICYGKILSYETYCIKANLLELAIRELCSENFWGEPHVPIKKGPLMVA